jgi:hypothetical protein
MAVIPWRAEQGEERRGDAGEILRTHYIDSIIKPCIMYGGPVTQMLVQP